MIALKEILENIEVKRVSGLTSRFIRNIQYDSRRVEPENAFIAIKGFHTDGHEFIDNAFERGARVFFVENDRELPDATVIQVEDTRKILPQISRIFFQYPEQKLKIVGITGTNGKTTVAYLLQSILKAAHWRPGLISTVEYFNGNSWQEAVRTTPEALDIFNLFAQMNKNKLKSAVMEVSSHALSLHRVDEIPFVAGVFTNLSRDHLDFHGSENEYFAAKQKLFLNFSENQKAVLNADDTYTDKIRNTTQGEIFTYSMTDSKATVSYLDHQVKRDGMQINLRVPSGNIQIETILLGDFNIYNIMAAVTTAISLGLQDNFIIEGIRHVNRIPGRCELYSTSAGISVYIDYAHTPEALRNILRAVWETRPNNLIVVFGAGGDRDKGKRPEMGKAAEDFSDRIILTNDNPRSEEPQQILAEIRKGIFEDTKVTVIPDRKEAIIAALAKAKRRDAVVIAGKGHEKYQEIAGQKLHFDDREIVQDFFKEHGWFLEN